MEILIYKLSIIIFAAIGIGFISIVKVFKQILAIKLKGKKWNILSLKNLVNII